MGMIRVAALAVSMLACEAHADPPCIDAKLREHIRDLLVQANDEALKEHIGKLFDVWMKEYGPDTSRARTGTLNGIEAYERAIAAAQRWNPLVCNGGARP